MPRMSEQEPVFDQALKPVLLGRIHLSVSADAAIKRAREVANDRHQPVGLSHIAFACMLDENLRLDLEDRIGEEKTSEAFRAVSEALNYPSNQGMSRLFSMAKWIHGRGDVEAEDLLLASASLQAQTQSSRKHLKRVV